MTVHVSVIIDDARAEHHQTLRAPFDATHYQAVLANLNESWLFYAVSSLRRC